MRLGRTRARQVVTVHVSETTLAIELDGQDLRTVRRTTTRQHRTHRVQSLLKPWTTPPEPLPAPILRGGSGAVSRRPA